MLNKYLRKNLLGLSVANALAVSLSATYAGNVFATDLKKLERPTTFKN